MTQPEICYLFYRPTEGRRLSRPGHRSNSALSVYHTGCHNKHICPRWNSFVGSFTPQSGILRAGPYTRV